MPKAILRLDADDVWSALETIDSVALFAEELIGRTIGHPDSARPPAGRLVPWAGRDADAEELVLFEHPSIKAPCAMPAESLRMFERAALSALAIRELLARGGVTVAIAGALQAIQPQLATIATHVPDIVHVAVCPSGDDDREPMASRLVEQLELAGIRLSVVATLVDSVFGANLVITTSGEVMKDGLDQVRPSHLVRGTVLVNTSGHDLPRAIVDRVDQIYVDDLALLAANSHRYVVARHLQAETGLGRPNAGQRSSRIAGDLGQLLTGAHPGREQADDIVLVELLRTNTLSVQLANKISEASRLRGLGVQVTA